ncbi:MAG: DNA ligase D, partial [Myxococcales bacterium]|nr:DNA ligase D [Myxococcales bacterium]
MAKASKSSDQSPAGAELRSYRDKRDPAATNEPFAPEPTRSGGATRRGNFVVHLHAARQRHYDLRIEVGGVLKSFAVPRGPSLDPEIKRLAVNTEDHPLPYIDFEEVIPPGNYGAGSMIVWDRGHVRYLEKTAEESIQEGKIDFELWGLKLKGRFALVHTGKRKEEISEQNQWLLFKKPDAYAKEGADADGTDPVASDPRSVLSGLLVEEMERRDEIFHQLTDRAAALGATEGQIDISDLEPMLCSTDDLDPSAEGWLYELKLDGVRIVARKSRDGVTLRYRNGRNATASYPEIVRAVRSLAAKECVVDGEIIAIGPQGRPDFHRLGPRIHAARPSDVTRVMGEVPVQYVVFDLLSIGDRDATGLPIEDRKALLKTLAPGKGILRTLDHMEGQGRALFEFCERSGLEGIVAKRLGSTYRPGPARSGDWQKIKCSLEDDFVVVGWTVGEGHRARLGALDLAAWDGSRWVYTGRVGTGLDDATIDRLLTILQPLAQVEPSADGRWMPAKNGRTYTRPESVVRVRFARWTPDGHLFHPVLVGLRTDIDPKHCRAAPVEGEEDALRSMDDPAQVGREDSRIVGRHRFSLSNQRKVFWPEDQITKGDLCDFYEVIAEAMLPYLRDRPVVLERYPNGIHGKAFHQWNAPEGTPSWVRTFSLRNELRDGKEVETFIIDDVDMLLHIANLGAIPIHVLASRTRSLDVCDFLTIDLDPGDSEFRHAITLARSLRDLLEDLELPSFPKTSGKSGLHVLVPLGADTSFDTAVMLTQLLGRLLETQHSDLGTTERARERRGGRVYIDTGQTGRSRTIVAPFSVRPVPGATVSTPLHWDEVGYGLDPKSFHI